MDFENSREAACSDREREIDLIELMDRAFSVCIVILRGFITIAKIIDVLIVRYKCIELLVSFDWLFPDRPIGLYKYSG